MDKGKERAQAIREYRHLARMIIRVKSQTARDQYRARMVALDAAYNLRRVAA